MSPPAVTVLMPAYNAEAHLAEAIDSILVQTFTNFEFLIIDDGSTDRTPDILKEYARRDSRIRLERNARNLGIAASINKGCDAARSPYIARLDADDICLPQRLALQYTFMEQHPEVWICGGQTEQFGNEQGYSALPLAHEEIMVMLLFANPFAHPTVMLRMAALRKADLRYDGACAAEDYDLWVRIGQIPHARMANLPDCLVRYRVHEGNLTSGKPRQIASSARAIRARLLRSLGLCPTEEDIVMHHTFEVPEEPVPPDYLTRAETWLVSLENANTRHGFCPPAALLRLVCRKWHALLYRALRRQYHGVWRMFLSRYFKELAWSDPQHFRQLAWRRAVEFCAAFKAPK